MKDSSKLGISEKLLEGRLSQLDREFYIEVERRIRDEGATENEVRWMFCGYTKLTLDCMMNSANLLDGSTAKGGPEKLLNSAFARRAQKFANTAMFTAINSCSISTSTSEEAMGRMKFKLLFGELSYVKIFETLLILKDSRILNDLELVTLYMAITTHANTHAKLALILQFIFHNKGSFDCLGIGLFAKAE